ncbi:hypothetical protein MGYG_06809 [Nannizzia gypsea CBS 118893]|uniref:Uncharacterized protein n=1 Tax=Arthroderma gypseum (strain ATCC MYA-4604 / CBS 118893) TaxID=535722 RepID=E4V194_ARTGP|nr:hypothetical protein MGYG_06809 [Nannizzia gypsea CBS 118893]EFR03809.1 hypothetical protein MGYG_06809 [Nannizzia gypsea CBS 118893]
MIGPKKHLVTKYLTRATRFGDKVTDQFHELTSIRRVSCPLVDWVVNLMKAYIDIQPCYRAQTSHPRTVTN